MQESVKKPSVFEVLSRINVNEHVEKKNGLTYLSWAWAWYTLKSYYPDSTYKVYKDERGCIYNTDGRTCWVETGVTVEGIEYIECLPVMDVRNRSIPLDVVTSVDVNKAIQRSLTKAISRHGLGWYIYAGEDLPEDITDEEEKPAPKKAPAKKASPYANEAEELEAKKKWILSNLPKDSELMGKAITTFGNNLEKISLGQVNSLLERVKEVIRTAKANAS